MDKEIIIRDFSRYAYLYDRYAYIQRRCALELLRMIEQDVIHNVLEIGCGTGNYTLLVRDKFRNARLQAIDISGKMIEVAEKKLKGKDVEFMVADAERFGSKKHFDIVTSNACFQWFEDLEAALAKYKSMLRKGGIISFSTFGPLTLEELNISLKGTLKSAPIAVTNFISKEKIEKILNQNFSEVKIREARYEESFACLKDLLYKIKYSGIRGNGLGRKTLCGKQFLHKLETAYLDRFKKIKSTYQVFFCQGKKS